MLKRLVHTANFKLALLYAAIFFASVAALGTILYIDVQQSLEGQMRERISAEMEQLLGDYRDDGMNELRHDIRERIEASPTNRLRYYVQNTDGRVIFDKLPSIPREQGWHRIAHLILLVAPLDEGYTLAIGGELTVIEDTQQIILRGLLVSFLFALVLAVVGGLIVSRRFLRRVDMLAKTAEMIGAGDLSKRIVLTGANDDFDQLAMTINRMLERIEQLLHEIKHVTTNIAHDLRTPLTKLRHKLESMEGGHPDIAEATALLDESLATFSALLRIAEVESGARREGFIELDLSALMTRLAEAYEPVAEEKGVRITRFIAPDVQIRGDRHLLAQLFSNLIENALKYGGREIILTLQQNKASIADTGSGIPAEEREHIVKPFYRLDKSRSTRGNGLGLSLVAAIATLHQMHLTLEDAKPGLKVTLEFTS